MLRANLSTRPFYNERAVHVVLGVVAALVAILTLVNIVQVISLSARSTELSRRVRADRTEADRLTREAANVRRGVDQNELHVVVAAAREANTLIDQRTFSWTSFFNRIEATLPADVMLASVRPTVDENGTKVTMIVLARRTEDIDEFMDKLEDTGAFANVLPGQSTETDEGLMQVSLTAMYVPVTEPRPGSAPKSPGVGP